MRNLIYKNHFSHLVRAIVAVLILSGGVAAQTTEFTYQGSLKDGAAPANTNYDFEFALFDAASGGTQIGATIARNTVLVTNGIFAVKLDFGSQFPGANRYLEIRVRISGGSGLTTLSPRQLINSAPYSVKTLNADNATNATNATTAVTFSGALAGDVTGTQNATTLANNVVTTAKITDSAVTSAKIAAGQVIKNVNGLTDNVTLAAGTNITITPAGNTLTIASTGGGGVGGSGTAGSVPVWSSGTALGNSVITQTNNKIGIGTADPGATLEVNVGGGVSVIGRSPNGFGVLGDSTSNRGVWGNSNGNGRGVFGESVSGQGVFGISTSNSGVYGETAVSSLTAGGVYGKGTGSGSIGVIGEANVANAVGVYGVSTSPTGFGVYARNLSGGRALIVEGNAAQDINSNGLVKATLLVNADGTINLCYNSQLTGSAATTPPCGFSVSRIAQGSYIITFPFQVNTRIFSVTIGDPNVGGGSQVFPNNATQLQVFTNGGASNNRFYLLVY